MIHARVANVKEKLAADFTSVNYFLKAFPCLQRSSVEVDVLQQQFALYQITPFSTKILLNSQGKDERMDTIWARIGELQDADGTASFKELADVMLTILTIFHSNADCERIFSMVRKVKTELHGKLGLTTLNAMLVQKSYNHGANMDCFNFKPTKELLKACKSSTNAYNMQHSSK